MHFHVKHQTRYRFSQPVFLEPHLLRFHPRSDGGQSVVTYQLEIDPEPVGQTRFLDPEGNIIQRIWFEGEWDALVLKVATDVLTSRTNPFDYLLDQSNQTLPLVYPPRIQSLVAAAQQRADIPSQGDPVRELSETIVRHAHGQLADFLLQLCEHLHEHWTIVCREHGTPWRPRQTLERRSGACRDLAWLFVDACRGVGLASRFVSGYQEGDAEKDDRDLHAWAEVFVPDAGWRGFDPTLGLAVGDRHVVVAAAVNPQDAAPVMGSIRGTGATSEMEVELEVSVRE